jgi:hypothetical protein
MPAKSTYTEEIGQEIARLMCDENLNLTDAVDKLGISYSTVMNWRRKYEQFDQEVSLAREALAERAVSEIKGLESRILSGDLDHQVANTVIHSMQWRIPKLAPRDWGERKFVENTLNGRVAVEHTKKLDISTLTEEQLDALEGALKATVLQLDAPSEDD